MTPMTSRTRRAEPRVARPRTASHSRGGRESRVCAIDLDRASRARSPHPLAVFRARRAAPRRRDRRPTPPAAAAPSKAPIHVVTTSLTHPPSSPLHLEDARRRRDVAADALSVRLGRRRIRRRGGGGGGGHDQQDTSFDRNWNWNWPSQLYDQPISVANEEGGCQDYGSCTKLPQTTLIC